MTQEDVDTTKYRNVHISNVARISIIGFEYETGRFSFSNTSSYAIFYDMSVCS
jgi:hypothetical protein